MSTHVETVARWGRGGPREPDERFDPVTPSRLRSPKMIAWAG